MTAEGRRFEDRAVLITGAAGAIGSATARRFLDEGARVVLVDRDEAALAKRAAALAVDGASPTTVVADLSSDEGAVQAVAAAEKAYGQLDAAALIAGISGPRIPVHELPVDGWDAVIAANLRSMFLSLQASARSMIGSGTPGAIVTMSSSMAQWDVLDGGAAYSSSKGAVSALTRAAAFDLARHGIRVNAVCPGVIDTSLGVPTHGGGDFTAPTAEQFARRIPLQRVGQAADVAAAVAYLASDDARHLTGSALLVDGGQTMQSWANSPREG